MIGDAGDVPTSKAGSVTHFEGEAVVENIQRFLDGDDLTGFYDGHANCFIETGFHKALLIDFDYDTEPLPGRFPESHLGPLPLLARVPAQPPRQARLPAALLARAAARLRHPRCRLAVPRRRTESLATTGSEGSP